MSGCIIRGLSLTRPWPFAFVNGPAEMRKLVENRSWKPPAYIVGHYLALHSAQSWDEEGREFIADVLGVEVPGRKEHPHGEIFAVCRLKGYATEEAQLSPLQQSWFFGPYCWLLSELVELPEPVPCAGALSLWRLEDRPGALEAVRDGYKRARGGAGRQAGEVEADDGFEL